MVGMLGLDWGTDGSRGQIGVGRVRSDGAGTRLGGWGQI